jgi:hypothetical protein
MATTRERIKAIQEKFAKEQANPKPLSNGKLQAEIRAHGPTRLPDGSWLRASYDATQVMWTGSLTIIDGSFNEVEFRNKAKSLFTLLQRLDAQYRKWIRQKESGDPK